MGVVQSSKTSALPILEKSQEPVEYFEEALDDASQQKLYTLNSREIFHSTDTVGARVEQVDAELFNL